MTTHTPASERVSNTKLLEDLSILLHATNDLSLRVTPRKHALCRVSIYQNVQVII